MKDPYWRHFPHEADIGVIGVGPNLAAAFAQAALGMTAVICDPQTVTARMPVDIDCAAPDPELLLFDWLNALIYEMATRRMLFSRFDVSINGDALHAQAWGEPVDVERHQPAVEIKGATYTQLKVFRDADGWWQVQCVVDV